MIFCGAANTFNSNRFPIIYDYLNIEKSLTKTLKKDKDEFNNLLKALTRLISPS